MGNLPTRHHRVNQGQSVLARSSIYRRHNGRFVTSAPRYPALQAWWTELAAGRRTPTTFDPLWRAACAEWSAIEHEADALPELAERYRADAGRIISQAAKQVV
jgi:hypothetical protein